MSTYFWMMCEGAYLQMVLFNTFDNDHRRMRLLCCLGWGLPGLAIVPYSLFRFVNLDTNCWMDLGDSAWFIGIPVVIIMIVNLLMLVNVIVMIRAKIQQDNCNAGKCVFSFKWYWGVANIDSWPMCHLLFQSKFNRCHEEEQHLCGQLQAADPSVRPLSCARDPLFPGPCQAGAQITI